jgi:hypothetical protein
MKNIPMQVRQVAEAFQASAMKAAENTIADYKLDGQEAADTLSFWKDRLYISNLPRDGKQAWVVGDNYDKGPSLIFYPREDAWYFMPSYGDEKKIEGGFASALQDARIMWTG